MVLLVNCLFEFGALSFARLRVASLKRRNENDVTYRSPKSRY